ncbi:MAG: hypothetical protein JWO12_2906 [Frankiales bacterium]|nr:hypothetical protein [Frankiales bacterium]
MTPDPVAVVVPTRDRPQHLATCLAALLPQLLPGDEVLVVDSASAVPVQASVTVLRAETKGASLARNVGWKGTSAPVVAFVDDDCEVAPGWRTALVAALEGVDMVVGGVTVPPAQEGAERAAAITALVPEQLLEADALLRGGSGNLAVRRSVLEQVGGFDERLGPGTWSRAGEDLEFQDRLLTAGFTGRFAPSVLAYHHQWRTRRELLRLDYGYGLGAGARAAWAGGEHGRRVLREALWKNGLSTVVSDLRKGYQLGVLTAFVRTAGALVGWALGLRRRRA